MNKLTGHPVVDAIGQLHFEGNITPHTWYSHIRYTNKRGTYTDHLAIAILAEIVYWYRPAVVHDENSNRQVGWKKKFRSDKLKKSYSDLSDKLGATDSQVRESVRLLKELDLIDIDLRVDSVGDTRIGNVMYVGLNPEKVREITFSVSPPNQSDPLPEMKDRVDPLPEMGVDPLPEMGESTIYKNTSKITSPLTPQGEQEGERNFGFEIRQDPRQSTATLLNQSEVTQLTSQTVLGPIIPAAAKTDRFFTGKTLYQRKYESWAEIAHPALVYVGEKTPWLEPPTATEFARFNQDFVDWHTTRSMQKFHKQDRFEAEGDFKSGLRNDPEKCVGRWMEYQKHMIAHAATAVARVNNGIDMTEAEKQKFAKHQRAFAGVTVSEVESVGIDPKILDAAKSASIAPQLESVATMTEDAWDAIASDMEDMEAQAMSETSQNAPEGAENHEAYKQIVKPEDRDFWAKISQQGNEPPTRSTPVVSAQQIKEQVEQINKARLATAAQVKAEKLERSRIEFWNNQLQSGNEGAIARTYEQVKKAGYIIVNGQVEDVEF